MRRELIVAGLVGVAIGGAFLLGWGQRCESNLDACFDRVSRRLCEINTEAGSPSNSVMRQRSALEDSPAPEGFGDWVMMAKCDQGNATVRFEQPMRPPI
jgi:hypothetical protein